MNTEKESARIPSLPTEENFQVKASHSEKRPYNKYQHSFGTFKIPITQAAISAYKRAKPDLRATAKQH